MAKMSRRDFLKVFSQTLIGGAIWKLVGKWFPVETAFAQSSSEAGKPSLDIRKIPVSDKAVQQMRSLRDISVVAKRMGEPEWSNVHRIQGENLPPVYMAPIPSTFHQSSGCYVMYGVSQTRHRPVVLVLCLQMSKSICQVSWQTPEGFTLAKEEWDPERKILLRREKASPGTGIEPLGLNWGCFLGCVGRNLPPYCLPTCSVCADAPVPENPFCIACAGCVGYGAFMCILACWE